MNGLKKKQHGVQRLLVRRLAFRDRAEVEMEPQRGDWRVGSRSATARTCSVMSPNTALQLSTFFKKGRFGRGLEVSIGNQDGTYRKLLWEVCGWPGCSKTGSKTREGEAERGKRSQDTFNLLRKGPGRRPGGMNWAGLQQSGRAWVQSQAEGLTSKLPRLKHPLHS